MRLFVVLGALLMASLAGCLEDGGSASLDDSKNVATGTPVPIDATLADVTTLVHGIDGLPIDPSVYPGDLPEFAEFYVGTRGAGEPTIGVTSTNAAFFPSIEFDAAGGALARTEVFRSRDGGQSWEDVTPQAANQDLPVQSLDPYIYVDPATDRVFSMDLYVGCSWLMWSDDEGDTWTHNPAACGIPVNDHQTLFSGPPTGLTQTVAYESVLYYCVNQVGQAICARSLDGGLAWSPGTTVFAGVEVGRGDIGVDDPAGVCGGLHGHGHASEATGTVYLPKGHCGVAMVGVSNDNGLTWETVVVDDTVGFDGHEAIVATDAEGTAYYFWLAANTYPYLSVSHDQGQTWGEPINVTAPGVTAAKFPSITAGDEGRIAFLYVGSTVEDGWAANESVMANATWHAYIGMSLDAHTEEPVFVTTTGNPADDPLKRGSCGGRCSGMFDFMDITINPATGQVYAALVDLCNDECAAPGGPDQVSSRGAVAVLVGGTDLISE